jgi:hypothetical protein
MQHIPLRAILLASLVFMQFLSSCGLIDKGSCKGNGAIQSEGNRVYQCSPKHELDTPKKQYLPGNCTRAEYGFQTDGLRYTCANAQGDVYFEDDQLEFETHVLCLNSKNWIMLEKKDAARSIWIKCDQRTPTAATSSWTMKVDGSDQATETWRLKDFMYKKLMTSYADDHVVACVSGISTAASDRSSVNCSAAPPAPQIEVPPNQ